MHPFRLSDARIETDNRLGRLRDGISYHKDEGQIVTAHAESPHSIVPEILHEDVVPDEHQRRHRRLAQQRRKSQPTLAAYVPSEKCEGLLAEPQAAQT